MAVKIIDVLLILLILIFLGGRVLVWFFKICCSVVFMAKDDA